MTSDKKIEGFYKGRGEHSVNQLEAFVEQSQAKIKELGIENRNCISTFLHEQRMAVVESENARLRSALGWIAEGGCDDWECWDKARAALGKAE